MAYVAAQTHPWLVQGMIWRFVFGIVMTAGLVVLIWDLVTIGRGETRRAPAVGEGAAEPATAPAPG
ncbi:MAG: hypothetical protein GWO02_10365 [Gammaproteobacteria bacterium]|nr:hypothetical protein [Gammaproteobacteria bacterium]